MSGGGPEEAAHRRMVNLVAAIAILALMAAAFWVIRAMDQSRKAEACLEAGRRDCAKVTQDSGG